MPPSCRSTTQNEAQALPEGPANPFSNAFIMAETDLLTTAVAQRDVCFATARCWRMKNPQRINPISGRPVAYKIMPGTSERPGGTLGGPF